MLVSGRGNRGPNQKNGPIPETACTKKMESSAPLRLGEGWGVAVVRTVPVHIAQEQTRGKGSTNMTLARGGAYLTSPRRDEDKG